MPIGSQPRLIGAGKALGYDGKGSMSKSIPIGTSHSVRINDLLSTPIDEGALHNWTYGIEFPVVKPFRQVIPFYDLAKALRLQHCVLIKMRVAWSLTVM
jgi:hypothetical protein